MKLKNLIAISLAAISIVSCSEKPQKYASYDDYPVYKGNDLGVTYSAESSTFKAWSPEAEEVRLNLYEDGVIGAPYATYDMKYDGEGVWKYTVKEDLIGKFFTFQIKQNDKWLGTTPGIWAKAVGCNGDRAAIIDWNSTNPEGWEKDKRPEMKSFTDAIIYEVHMRDFTISPTSGSSFPGKFLGLSETGTKSPEGEKTGLDHLLDLGISHVQILPMYDYGSIDETKLNQNNYNWGYDPKNYNVPEGGYSTDPYTPNVRIYELKSMIQKLHSVGIRVIMDVVYNHTFVGAESHLNLMAPGYFYRMKSDSTWSNGSGCGNETASERPMMRQFIIESVKYWINEYHIDGFRFDLMGIHDIETMKAIRAAVDEIDPSISIHGEGWAGGECAIPGSERAVKQNAPLFAPIAVFSDNIRDGLRGNWTEGDAGGFLAGKDLDETIKFGIVGATNHPQVDFNNIIHSNAPYATTPAQVINYVSCHDDPCIVDKLKATCPEATIDEIIKMDLLAQTIVFTSQGVPFIYAGEEVLRDKKMVHNSYNSPDSINEINWSNKAKYNNVYKFYRSLIQLRRCHPAFRMNSAESVAENLRFMESEPGIIAYTINAKECGDSWSKIMVILNRNKEPKNINLDGETWNVYLKDETFIVEEKQKVSNTITINPTTAIILYQE